MDSENTEDTKPAWQPIDPAIYHGLPLMRWFDIRQGKSETTRKFLAEKGPHLVTANGDPILVILTLEQYLEREKIPPNPSRERRRIDGVMWYRF